MPTHADRPPRSAVRLIAATSLATVALAVALFVALAVYQRERELDGAAQTTRRYAALLAEHVGKVLEASNLAMQQAAAVRGDRDWSAVAGDRDAFGEIARMERDLTAVQALWLVDESGTPRLTSRAFPAPLYEISGREHFQAQVEQDRGFFISRLLHSRITGGVNVVASRRLTHPDGRFAGVALVVLDPDRLLGPYADLPLPTDSEVTLFREDLALVARAPRLPDEIAVEAQKWRTSTLPLRLEATLHTVSATDGIERIESYQKVAGFPVWVGVGVPMAAVARAWQERVADQGFPAAVALLLVAGFGLAAWRAAAREAHSYTVLEQRVAERTAELRDLVRQRDLLVREVNHRVTNNLQIAASLLAMQAGRADDGELARVLEQARMRILAIADLHGFLYRAEDLSEIRLDRYVGQLCCELRKTVFPAGKQLVLQTRLAPVSVPTDHAIPIGLILTELVTNAAKHAFLDRDRGTIEIGLAAQNGSARLAVRDNGRGHPSDAGVGYGMRLVDALVAQLGGAMSAKSAVRSTEVEIIFPLAAPPAAEIPSAA